MDLKEVKHELRIVAERLKERLEEIVEQPDLVTDEFHATVEVGMLDEIELLKVKDFIGYLDDELSDQSYVVEIKYGTYRSDCDWPVRASFTTEVVADELGDSFEYVDDCLEFDVGFSLVVFQCTEWDDCFAITEDVYNERMATFEEMTEEEWEAYDS